MNQYTTTSSVPLQQQILFLLCRLMVLRVNYALLDSDRLFVNSVLRQLDLIKRGHVREAPQLLSYIFQFLILLAQARNSMTQLVDMPRVLALAAEIIGSSALRPRQALPALRPIVHELFVVSLRAPPRSRPDLLAMQDQVVDMLMHVVAHPPVLDQLHTLLRGVAHDEERHRRLSRRVVDALLPLMARRRVAIRNPRVLWVVHRLMEGVAPISLRPVVLLIRCMFDAAAGEIPVPGGGVGGGGGAPPRPPPPAGRGAWLPIVLVLLRVLARNPEVALLAGLQDIMVAGGEPPAAAPSLPPPAVALVQFLFAAILRVARDFTGNPAATDFDSQQFAQLLQFVFVILNRSDSARLLAAARQQAAAAAAGMQGPMSRVVVAHPLLAVYWCQLLVLLQVDRGAWRTICGLDLPAGMAISCGQDVSRRGAFLLHCESLVQQQQLGQGQASENGPSGEGATAVADAAAAATAALLDCVCGQDDGWFRRLFELCTETPVTHLLAVTTAAPEHHPRLLCRVEAALATVPPSTRGQVPFVTGLLRALSAAPPSPALIALLLRQFLPSRHLAARRLCDAVAAAKLRAWLASMAGSMALSSTPPPAASRPGVVGDLFALFQAVVPQPRTCPQLCAVFTEQGSAPLARQSATIEELVAMSPDSWHLQFVSTCCHRDNRSGRSDHAVCELLRHLQADALMYVDHRCSVHPHLP